MREIKFRFWNTTCNKLVYLEQYKLGDMNGQLSFIDLFNDNRGWIWEQYIGLKDKNGKEIYEGDIVMHDWGDNEEDMIKYTVLYNNNNKACFEPFSTEVIDIDYIVVVGNIHENPELLEDK